MKKSPVTLAIPTPCHENWQAMTPAEQGRFCQSCQKTVMDFTSKTDREVARYFEQSAIGASTGSTCGRFRPDQLHRPLHIERPGSLGTKLRALGLVLPGLLLGGFAQAQTERPVLMGKVACPRPTTTQVEPRIVGEVTVAPPKALMGDTIAVQAPAPRIITGVIMDKETNEPLIGGTVILKGTNTGATSDMDGRYEIAVPADIEDPMLEFSYTGYTTIHKPAAQASSLNVEMEPSLALKGDIVVVGFTVYKQEETVYNIAKLKIQNLLNNMRGRKNDRNANQELMEPSTIETPTPLPLPTVPATEFPSTLLPEAIPVEVFPNPFSHVLSIKIDCPNAERLNIRLMDIKGQVVFTQTYEAMKGPQVLTLETESVHLPSGQYLLELSNGEVLRYAGLVVKE